MSEETCDRCGQETENGAGHYLDELGIDDRVCTDCYEKAEMEFRQITQDATLAKGCVHCQRQVFPTVNGWADFDATGDDYLWRFVCDGNDAFQAPHEVTA